MLSNLSKWAIVSAMIIVGLLLTGCTIAAPTTTEAAVPDAPVPEGIAAPVIELAGTGPDYPMMPTGEWMEISSGEYQWFAFAYDFDEDFEPIEIRMYAEPTEGAILTVRNAEQANLWREDGTHEHIGCCTVQVLDKNADDDDVETPYAVWAGTLDSSGIYYLVVEHAKNLAEPVSYRFEFAGAEGVAMPAELYATVAEAPVTEPEVLVEEMAIEVETIESGPDFAMRPTGEWVSLEEGAYHWYAFDYDFDEDFDPFEVRIYTEPENGAVLTIRNAEQAQEWREDGTHEHIGCCTVQVLGKDADDEDIETPYAVWAGTLGSSGTYYIVIENAEGVSGPVYYMFTIEGEGISY